LAEGIARSCSRSESSLKTLSKLFIRGLILARRTTPTGDEFVRVGVFRYPSAEGGILQMLRQKSMDWRSSYNTKLLQLFMEQQYWLLGGDKTTVTLV
jgi:hypothetical protein